VNLPERMVVDGDDLEVLHKLDDVELSADL
jgi:hypothetical protein